MKKKKIMFEDDAPYVIAARKFFAEAESHHDFKVLRYLLREAKKAWKNRRDRL